MMSSDENKLLVRRFYEEVVNTGKVDLIERFIAQEYVGVSDGKRPVIGVEGAKAHILGVRQTFCSHPIKAVMTGQYLKDGITNRP